jgi:integrase
MTKRRLTAPAVARLKPGAKRKAIPDGGGLYLLIQPSGHKSFALAFRGPGGRMAKLTLGPYSPENSSAEPIVGAPLSLAAARALATDILHRRAAGEDVVGTRLREKAELRAAAANTFAVAAGDFIREHSMRKVRGWRAQAKLLGLNGLEAIPGGLAERWRDRPITSIDGHDVHKVVDECRKRGVPGTQRRSDGVTESRARAMFRTLSKLFNWLTQQRRVDANPCASVHRPETPRARERVLTDGEIRKLWAATDKIGAPFGSVIKLLLLTGQRLNEVAGLRWEEIVGDEIHLPASRTKNKRAHVVALSKPAQAILSKVQRVPESAFVFSVTGYSAISGWSKVKKRLDALMGVTDWRIHDLRRTAATGLARAGADLPVIERALNHVSGSFGGIVGVYQQHKYADEVRAAMEAWANLLLAIVEGRPAKVVPIRGR